MNNEKYYEGWNKGKDLTPDDLVVLPKEKGYNIYLRFGAPYPYYPQEVENAHTKYFVITSENSETEEDVKNTKIDLCDSMIENFNKIKEALKA